MIVTGTYVRCPGVVAELLSGGKAIVALNEASPVIGSSVEVSLGPSHRFSLGEAIVVTYCYQRSWEIVDGERKPVEHLCISHCRPSVEESSTGRKWTREELERVSLGFREQFEKLGREDEKDCPL